jgi:hypothetical protein
MNFKIGDYIINNEIIPLYLYIEIDDQEITINVPLPCNYPKTTLYKSMKLYDEDDLLYATLSVKNLKSKGWHVFLPEKHPLMENALHQIILREFFSYAKDKNINLNDDEKIMINGLGKKVLCLGIPIIIEHFNIDPYTTPISLTSRIPTNLRLYYNKSYGFEEIRPSYDKESIKGYVMATMLSTFMNHC